MPEITKDTLREAKKLLDLNIINKQAYLDIKHKLEGPISSTQAVRLIEAIVKEESTSWAITYMDEVIEIVNRYNEGKYHLNCGSHSIKEYGPE